MKELIRQIEELDAKEYQGDYKLLATEDFMKSRCDAALKGLERVLSNAFLAGNAKYTPVLPLYCFDFKGDSRDAESVRFEAFGDWIEDAQRAGFDWAIAPIDIEDSMRVSRRIDTIAMVEAIYNDAGVSCMPFVEVAEHAVYIIRPGTEKETLVIETSDEQRNREFKEKCARIRAEMKSRPEYSTTQDTTDYAPVDPVPALVLGIGAFALFLLACALAQVPPV